MNGYAEVECLRTYNYLIVKYNNLFNINLYLKRANERLQLSIRTNKKLFEGRKNRYDYWNTEIKCLIHLYIFFSVVIEDRKRNNGASTSPPAFNTLILINVIMFYKSLQYF